MSDMWLQESWDPEKLATVARRIGTGLMVVAEERERADALAERCDELEEQSLEKAERLALEAGVAKLAAHEYRQQADMAITVLENLFFLFARDRDQIGAALTRKLKEYETRWGRIAATWPSRGQLTIDGEAVLEVVVPLAPGEPVLEDVGNGMDNPVTVGSVEFGA